MLRLSGAAVVLLAVTLPPARTPANELHTGSHHLFCPASACFDLGTPFPAKHLHKFYPTLHDGSPMVDDFQTDPTGFHGVGCVSSWHPVVTPEGRGWALARDCWSYY